MVMRIINEIGPFLEKPQKADNADNGGRKVKGEDAQLRINAEKMKAEDRETVIDVYTELKALKGQKSPSGVPDDVINGEEEASKWAEAIKAMFKENPLNARSAQAGKIDNRSLALLLD